MVFGLGCSYQQRLEALLAERGILVTTLLEFGGWTQSSRVLEPVSGPRCCHGAWSRQQCIIAIYEISPDKARIETLFVRRHDAYISSAMRAFVEVSRSEFGPLWRQRSGDRTILSHGG